MEFLMVEKRMERSDQKQSEVKIEKELQTPILTEQN